MTKKILNCLMCWERHQSENEINKLQAVVVNILIYGLCFFLLFDLASNWLLTFQDSL